MASPERNRHFAVIPARMGSKGFPDKNRYFFGFTADFLDASGIFDGVLVTSNDELILGWAKERGYHTRRRPASLASESARIKDAIVDLVENTPLLEPDDYLWLVYTTTIYKNPEDFHSVLKLLEEKAPKAFCTFIEVETHPYITWYQDSATGKMRQYVPNNVTNRQEFPAAWRNYHYIIGFTPRALPDLNANLLGGETYPIFLSPEQRERLCDLDRPEDLIAWKEKHPDQFEKWRRSLPAEIDLAPLAHIIGLADGNGPSEGSRKDKC